MCGVDTVALAEDMKPKGWTGRRPRGWLEVRAFTDATHVEDCERFRAALGAQYCARELNRYWDADHVVPVVEGGGGCGLENYRTLCIPCHRIETAELRRRLAERKRGST
jgi:5-methylcytosine-specific restriction endonuclease McrA